MYKKRNGRRFFKKYILFSKSKFTQPNLVDNFRDSFFLLLFVTILVVVVFVVFWNSKMCIITKYARST